MGDQQAHRAVNEQVAGAAVVAAHGGGRGLRVAATGAQWRSKWQRWRSGLWQELTG